MLDKFRAQALVETRASKDRTLFELTFVDAQGESHTLAMSRAVVQDLVPVLQSLAESKAGAGGATQLTKMPKRCAVGHAAHEQFVLIRFDDDPPYAIGLDDARSLWREVRDESEDLSRRRQPAFQ